MSKIETVRIKGGEYAMVHARVRHFRSEPRYKEFSISTDVEFFDHDKGYIVIKATVRSADNRTLASGLAHEFRDDRSSMVNKTSFVENAETSAIGRALACLGIGIEDAYASSFEVEQAILPALAEKMDTSIPEDKCENLIPKSVKTYGGRDISSLSVDELMDLSTIATSERWKEKIALAMNTAVGDSGEFLGEEVIEAPDVDDADLGGWSQSKIS